MNVATFTIESLIVHDVPRRRVQGDGGEELLLSEVPSRFDAGLRNFFTERMKRSLSRNHYEVERDPESTSPVPDQVVELLGAAGAGSDDVLVRTSRVTAEHLYSTQTGSNSPGLLIVCRGRVDGVAAVAVMKLEREDAVRVSQVQQDGHPTFDVEYLRDLMLGKNTRVFKASLFALDGDALDGLVSDAQRSDVKIEVANFGLPSFVLMMSALRRLHASCREASASRLLPSRLWFRPPRAAEFIAACSYGRRCVLSASAS